MTKLEQIRQKFIETTPDILKLEFGCEVDRGAGEGKREFIAGMFNDTVALTRNLKNIGDFLPFNVPKDLMPKWKILGRPIRLADVLVAMGKTFPEHKKIIAVLDSGRFYDVDTGRDDKEMIYLNAEWNLLKDDLTQQSPETIDFIYSILSNNT